MVSKSTLVVSGFPTAGKSTVGEILKSRFGLAVADLDSLIEEATGKPIKNLIREEGEEAFRDCESKALENALTAKEFEVLVVGGGAVLREVNRKLIADHTHVSLNVLSGVAAKRAFEDEQLAVSKGIFPQRPLLAPLTSSELCLEGVLGKVEDLKNKRELVLRDANVRIDTSWASPEAVAKIIAAVAQGKLLLPDNSLIVPIALREDGGFEMIVVGVGVRSALWQLEAILDLDPQKRAYVVDERVAAMWSELVSGQDAEAVIVTLASGEKSKDLSEVGRVCEVLAENYCKRSDEVVAVGGGVVGDVAGLVSSLYMRGMNLVHMPTTIVAQVDSSIGGKTGVNLRSGKNLVGTFEPAKLIVSDIELLSTLPKREFQAGLAEVIKYGLIRSGEFFSWVEEREAAINARDAKTLLQMVEHSTLFKLDFVHGDIRDVSGQRAQLNFGHTAGHAMEKLSSYSSMLHGEAVAIGMVVACCLGEALGVTPKDIRPRLVKLLRGFDLPVSVPRELVVADGVLPNVDMFLRSEVGKKWVSVLQLDKKRTKESANFVLLTKLGAATCLDVRLEAILAAVLQSSALQN